MGQEQKRQVWFVLGVSLVGAAVVLLIPAVFHILP